MKLWLTLLSALMVSACATDPIALPDFEEAVRSDKEVTNPVDLPMLCEIPWTSSECYQRLGAYEDVAEGNTETAQLNADIARDGEAAYDFILNSARNQQSIAVIREDMLEEERKDHFFDNLWHRLLIALGVLGAVL